MYYSQSFFSPCSRGVVIELCLTYFNFVLSQRTFWLIAMVMELSIDCFLGSKVVSREESGESFRCQWKYLHSRLFKKLIVATTTLVDQQWLREEKTNKKKQWLRSNLLTKATKQNI